MGSGGEVPSFMRPFVDSHHAKLDKKRRVSFPASFRAKLESIEDGADQAGDTRPDRRKFYLRPHHLMPCVEGFTETALSQIDASLSSLPAYSDEQELLSLALLGSTAEVTYDAEGRFSMPEEAQAHAGIEEALVFVGLGQKFQIWEPAQLARRKIEAQALLRLQRPSLPQALRS